MTVNIYIYILVAPEHVFECVRCSRNTVFEEHVFEGTRVREHVFELVFQSLSVGIAVQKKHAMQITHKNDEKTKVLRMSLPIVESLSGLQESILSRFRSTQFNHCEKSKE